MTDAYKMVVEALGLALEERIKENNIPVATEIDKLQQEEGAFSVIVEFDLLEYRKKHSSRSVKKTLSIFVRQSLRNGGIPFDIIAKKPNDDTIAAVIEAHRIVNGPNTKGYNYLEELFNALKDE